MPGRAEGSGAASPSDPLSTGTPAAQYLRTSSRESSQSLAYQEHLIATFCASEGYDIIETYRDVGRSGLTTKHRAGLKALLQDVMTGVNYTTVVVADVSRWGRYQDPDEGAHYEFLCRAAGVNVVYCASVFGGDDEASPAGTLVKSVRRLLAAEYSRERAAWTRAGLARVFQAGGWMGGPAPYGFARRAECPRTGVATPLAFGESSFLPGSRVRLVWGPANEVALIKRIYRLYLEKACSVSQISALLAKEGTVGRGGLSWTPRRVRNVLRNELVTGVLARGRSKRGVGEEIEFIQRDAWVRRRVMKAIVSRERFEEAQARLRGGARFRNIESELIADLARLLRKAGTLDRALVDADGRFPASAYVNRFGSLQAAFRRAGFERRTRDGQHVEAMSKGEMRDRVMRVLQEEGFLSAALIKKRGDVPSTDTLRRVFGSLNVLYDEVGFTTDRTEQLRLTWERRRTACAGKSGQKS